jgi:hypothetical protein
MTTTIKQTKLDELLQSDSGKVTTKELLKIGVVLEKDFSMAVGQSATKANEGCFRIKDKYFKMIEEKNKGITWGSTYNYTRIEKQEYDAIRAPLDALRGFSKLKRSIVN